MQPTHLRLVPFELGEQLCIDLLNKRKASLINIEMKVFSRKEAKSLKLKHYYRDKPCKHGHTGPFRTSNGSCLECDRISAPKYKKFIPYSKGLYLKYIEHHKRNSQTYYQEHKDDVSLYYSERRKNNLEQVRAQGRKSYHKNKNSGKHNFRTAKRRALLKQAIPKWAEMEQIRTLYKRARYLTLITGIEHQIDHVVPLINGNGLWFALFIKSSNFNKRRK